MRKQTICVDFDGVIHSYTSPWVNAATILDGPTPGVIKWLACMTDHFDVTILSARSQDPAGLEAMQVWLSSAMAEEGVFHCFHRIKWPTEKPGALLYIDDRAWRFDGPGTLPTPDDVKAFKPWNRCEPSQPKSEKRNATKADDLRRLADYDSHAGEPLGKSMRSAATAMDRMAQALIDARSILSPDKSPNARSEISTALRLAGYEAPRD